MHDITAGILVIGDEILSGRTHDKNIPFLANEFTLMGIKLREVAIIPDDKATIVANVQEFSKRFTYVITTGGIGPTHDDITVECVAAALNLELEFNQTVVERMKEHYKENLNDARLKMARAPIGAMLIESSVSHIPSFMAKNVLVLAGIPKIMQSMFLNAKQHFKHGAILHSLAIQTDLPEGDFGGPLEDIQKAMPDVLIGSYPHYGDDGKNHAEIVMRSKDKHLLQEAADRVSELLKTLAQKS